GGFGARAGFELGEDGSDVMVNRLRRYEQAIGDLAVAQPVGDEREDFQLPVRQSRGVLSRARSGAARDAAHTAGAQRLTQPLRGWPGPESVKDPERRARGLFVAVRQRHRLFVRTTDLSPRRGGSA